MTIGEFFNPHDPRHIAAYRHLEKTGSWPDGFIPDDMEFPCTWHVLILAKMAQAWKRHMEENS